MRLVLITSTKNWRGVLVELPNTEIIDEVLALVDRKVYSCAMAYALYNGTFERELKLHEISELEADLILSPTSARWDLMN